MEPSVNAYADLMGKGKWMFDYLLYLAEQKVGSTIFETTPKFCGSIGVMLEQ